MIERATMQVCSRGRVYTTDRQREELGLVDGVITPEDPRGCGRGTALYVAVEHIDRSPEWDGGFSQCAVFETTLNYHGGFRIPAPVRERMDLSEGDTLRVSMERVSDEPPTRVDEEEFGTIDA